MTHRKRGLRAVVGFVGALAILAGLIAWAAVALRDEPAIVPPESPEAMAMRKSPENAYFVLLKTAKRIPLKPPMLRVKGAYGQDEPYQPEEESVGKVLGIWRPDDDPLMAQYMKDAEPIISDIESACDKPCFRVPEIPPYWFSAAESIDRHLSTRSLRTLLDGYVLYQQKVLGNADRALACRMVAVRFAHLLAEDGGLYNYSIQNTACNEATKQIIELLKTHAVSAEALQAAVEQVEVIRSHLRPIEDVAMFQLRTYALAQVTPVPARSFINRLSDSRKVKKITRFLLANRERILDGVRMDDCTVFTSHPDIPAMNDDDMRDPRFVVALHYTHAGIVTTLNKLLLALRLEQYRLDHGAYPESLAAVAAVYPGMPTTDGYCDHPFVYEYRPSKDTYGLGISEETVKMM